jgi:prenyltransferase beta subunit
MKFLEIFSKNIFKLFAGRFLSRLSENSLEATLARSLRMLDAQTIDEIKNYIKGQQTKEGGFADKAGNSDLYYTLFGCLVAEAFEIDEVKPALKAYLKNIIATKELSGIYLKCALIIYAKLFGGTTPPSIIGTNKRLAAQYSDFINVLSYYYSKDYISLLLISQKLKKVKLSAEMPCSVMAASLILQDGKRKQHDEPWQWMSGYYRNGGFSAFSKIADSDLLSTGVALYSLRFVDSDLSVIKPDCLTYIDSLYSEGGFCASTYDAGPDVEYTFYGLLGLGSLTY